MQPWRLFGFSFGQAALAPDDRMTKTENAFAIHCPPAGISRTMRERLAGQNAKTFWLTGLSGAGKTTLANAIERELHRRGRHTYLLDGDDLRSGLNSDLGFSEADRAENIRRAAEVAGLMLDAGLIVIAAFISPLLVERQMARKLIGDADFLEIHVSTPLHICEMRDPKGLYDRARQGAISNMAGLDSPYEAPTAPFATFDGSGAIDIEQAAGDIVRLAFPTERVHGRPAP